MSCRVANTPPSPWKLYFRTRLQSGDPGDTAGRAEAGHQQQVRAHGAP